ncbi:MAG: acyl carrier protein [Coprobacillus sp.]
MEKLFELLEEIDGDIDFKGCTTLIDDGILDSFAILEIVSEINEEFDVQIGASDIVPENFNSAEAMMKMIQRLQN